MSQLPDNDIQDIYELSPLQQGLLFHSLLDPSSGAYVIQPTCVLRGHLDLDSFARAWQLALDRHDILRTTFHWGELDKPLQIVHATASIGLAVDDWRNACSTDQRDKLGDLLETDRRAGFDIEHAPLMRLRLLRLGDDTHQLIWTLHHLLLDGWSAALVLKEVFAAYQSIVSGDTPELPEVAQYGDFIGWLQRQDEQGAEAFWRTELAGFSTPTPFSVELKTARQSTLDTDYAAAEATLPRRLTDRLQAFSRQHGITLNTTVQGAWANVLSRCSGEADVLWGCVVSGRSAGLPSMQRMVGMFINTLPIRAQVLGDEVALHWLQRLQERLLNAYQYEYTPLPRIQACSDVRPGQPLFESLVAFENYPMDGSLAPDSGLQVSDGVCLERTSYPLTLSVMPGEQLRLRFLYDLNRFDRSTVLRMAGHLETWLDALVERPEALLSELPLLTPAEREQVLVEWNQTSAPVPEASLAHELVEEQAQSAPDRVAVVDEAGSVSYGELSARANRLGRYLRRLGVGPEVVTAVLVPRCADMIVAPLAVLKAGGAYLPLDPSLPAERLAFLLADSGARVLITHRSLAAQIPGYSGAIVLLDGEAAQIGLESPEDVRHSVSSDALAYIIYTSGSTGVPKGSQITHRNLLNLIFWHRRAFTVTSADRATQVAGLAFDATVWEIWPYLTAGAAVYLAPDRVRMSPEAMRDWLLEQNITVSFLPTSLAEAVLALPWPPACNLRLLLTGADTLHLHPRADLPFQLVNNYGPTECTVVSTSGPVPAAGASTSQLPSIGKPIDNVQAYVVDRFGQPAPVLAPGELLVGGANVGRGYLDRPELTGEKFITNVLLKQGSGRLYRTGDLVRYLPDGSIEFLGRMDGQVKIRGFRIELGEVEAALRRHPQIQEVVVDARQAGAGEKQLVAYAVPSADRLPPTDELRAFLASTLPDYMIPSSVVTLVALPLTANGKVDRKALPDPPQERPELTSGFAAPAGEVEELIAAAFREVLAVDRVGREDNFFDLGANSLSLVRVHAGIVANLGRDFPLVSMFQYPTVRRLGEHLAGAGEQPLELESPNPAPQGANQGIAIIGMAGRFPGASNLEEFWRNLRNGVESVSFFGDEELLAAGVDASVIDRADYVKARAVLEDIDLFDAAFFGFSPREADVLDPQQRLFLEAAWETLEAAGYDPAHCSRPVGVYGGASSTTYGQQVLSNPSIASLFAPLQLMIASDKDHLATRVAYKLNLKGPALTVQTACSTSLVAVATACQALVDGHCDMALAGGVSAGVPQKSGYVYQEGGILSPDGHCRPFDADAKGTIGGSGVGVVLLKRVERAIKDGDQVLAVIKGWATNNDGSLKVAYTAPSVEGQAEVVASAQAMAGVSAGTISYVEAHGTGTTLGDPIEIAALTRAFRASTPENGFCAIGSVKGNIGHLDAAAGVAGLIKTVLALRHGEIPPSVNYSAPNPGIDFDATPFSVNAELAPWPERAAPRRAGVSSFGIGGTNAHLVLEESPLPVSNAAAPAEQLLVLSAQSEAALDRAAANLGEYLGAHRNSSLADVAYTLQLGRTPFPYRRAVVVADTAEAPEALSARAFTGHAGAGRRAAFLFPGQGAQYVDMGRQLYEGEAVFREAIDRCAELLRPSLGLDLRSVLYPAADHLEDAAQGLGQTALTQPALFALEYGLAQVWMSWGVHPTAMLGHSIGEYVAACLAGVFSLEDGLRLVAARGRLMQAQEPGAMLAVNLPEAQLLPLLDSRLSLAAVNGPELSIASGPYDAIEALEQALAQRGAGSQRLRTSHAFHSAMMEPALASFECELRQIRLSEPTIPYLSNVTGDWITKERATDPRYWVDQLRHTVRFGDGLARLLRPDVALLEVGPSQSLSRVAAAYPARPPEQPCFATDGGRQGGSLTSGQLLRTLGKLWASGVTPDWTALHRGERRLRVALPTYPFERERHWVEAVSTPAPIASDIRQPLSNWFYGPSWKRSFPMITAPSPFSEWLVFADGSALARRLVERLRGAGHRVTTVQQGPEPADYARLLSELGSPPERVIHMWQEAGFSSLLHLARALAGQTSISVVGSEMLAVATGEPLDPDKASLLGLARVIPQELPHVRCRVLDVERAALDTPAADLVDALIADVAGDTVEAVAYRGRDRWVQSYEPLPLQASAESALKVGGCYLITGGLGHLGQALAQHLATITSAKLVLIGRTLRDAVQTVEACERAGAEVLVLAADVSDREQMERTLATVRSRFGRIDGVFHLAGGSPEGIDSLDCLTDAKVELNFGPKARALALLTELFEADPPELWVLFSSLSSILGGLHFGAYAAANAYLDAFAQEASQHGSARWVSINWDAWAAANGVQAEATPAQIQIEEGMAVLDRILAGPRLSQVAVSTTELGARLRRWVGMAISDGSQPGTAATPLHSRRGLTSRYVAPATELEETVAGIWQSLLGVDQIGLEDDFFEAGGHSLLAIQLISRLRSELSVQLPVQAVFDASTLAQLAERIELSLRPKDASEQLERLLEHVEQLSDEDLLELVAQTSHPQDTKLQ